MKNFLVSLLLLVSSIVSAQTVDSYTGNLVYTTSNTSFSNPPPDGWATHIWSGFVGTNSTGQGYSGGSTPGWNANTGTFMFGYTQRTISYTTPVNVALSNAGTGIQVTGLKYSWEYINQDYSRGNLSGNINLTSNTGQVLQNYNYNMPRTTNGWTTMSGTEIFSTQYAPSSLGSLNVSFNGKDDRYWAGYYGPQIRDINVGLTYNVPPPPPVPTDFAKWIKLTDENGDFTLSKAGVVRYGANGTYIYQSLQAGTYSCSNGAWGNDPIGGVYKECDLGSNTTSTPTLPKSITTTSNSSLPLLDPVTTPTTTTTTTTQTTTTGTTTDTTGTPTTSYVSTSGSNSNTGTPTTDTQTTTQQTSSTSVATSSPVTSPVQQAVASQTAPSATQTKVGEVSDSGGSSKTTVSLSSVLSMISSNQDKTAALEKSVVQAADAQAFSAGETAKQNAEKIAGEAATQSASAGGSTSSLLQLATTQSSFSGPMQGGAFALQGNTQSNNASNAARLEQSLASVNTTSNVNVLQGQQISVAESKQDFAFAIQQPTTYVYKQPSFSGSDNVEYQQSNTFASVGKLQTEVKQETAYTGIQVSVNPSRYEPPKNEQTFIQQSYAPSAAYQAPIVKQEYTVAAVSSSVSYSLLAPTKITQQTQIETPVFEGIKFGGNKTPVESAIESKPIIQQSSTVQQADTVKKNVDNNELAGGVTIESMAKQPANYTQYFAMIPDAAFYAVKEIYKNQRNVDNERAFRSLGSDRLHQQMVDQQFR